MKQRVSNTASRDVVNALWSETLSSAYQKMKMIDCRHLPVIDDRGRLVGILSDRDVQRGMIVPDRSIADVFPKAEIPEDAMVSDFMSSPVVTIMKDESIAKAARLMIDEKISALVVLDGPRVTGIITSEDLLKVLVELIEDRDGRASKFVDRLGLETSLGNVSHLLSQAGI